MRNRPLQRMQSGGFWVDDGEAFRFLDGGLVLYSAALLSQSQKLTVSSQCEPGGSETLVQRFLSNGWHCVCITKTSDEWHAHANAVAQPAMIDLVRDAFEQG